MNQRVGKYLVQTIAGEAVSCYIPPELPPHPDIDIGQLQSLLEKATLAIGKLNSISLTIPNTSLFIYMYVRKEALLSSQIEGTQSSFSDLILFEHNERPNIAIEDVEEVSNYVKAIHYGLERLENNFPLSLRLIKETHQILLCGTRGANKLPGEFRRSQNWIGGTRPGNALFVPPPANKLLDCLSNFETFLHNNSLPTLVKAAIAHAQFETIHPFLDGNGRLGRLLITLLLCEGKMLEAPTLYLSLFLKQNRTTYYNLLQEVRLHGTWETWIEFFLEGVTITSKQVIDTTILLEKLFNADLNKIRGLGRARFSCEKVFESLKQLPQTNVASLADSLAITKPTARSALNQMLALGIIEELSGKKRDKVYIYKNYLSILEEGAEPF